jgi:type IV pilus assembly protein PilC
MIKRFNYKAKNNQGNTVNGIVEARTQKGAVKLLQEKNLIVLKLTEKKENIFDILSSSFFKKIKIGNLTLFTRQLSTMMNTGLPLSEALGLLQEQTEGRLSEIIGRILAKVEGGSSLAESLAEEEGAFSEVYLASIRAGEEGGVLETVLERLADNLEKQKEFLGKVKGAMIYPIIIIIGMIGVTFIMMIFVIPKMMSLYEEFDAEMPLPTQILMTTANLVSGNVWVFPTLIVGAFVFYKYITANEEYKLKLDNFKLKVPIIGPLTKAVNLAEINRTMSILLAAGVSLVEALEIVAQTADNQVYRKALEDSANRVEKGVPLSKSWVETKNFPPIMNQMAATGEQTGQLDEVLSKVSQYFEVQAEEKVKGLTSAIEPLIMIVLGIGVGFLVIAIILPLYNLTSQF